MPRWQVAFSRGEQARWISHLDLMRAWERTFRRAGIHLALSKGFQPHPKMALALPLPVGVLGLCERLDVTVDDDLESSQIRDRLASAVPAGLGISTVMPLEGPPLAARVSQAVYRAHFAEGFATEETSDRIRALLSSQSLTWERKRDQEVRRYDLRSLIDDLWIDGREGEPELWMRLRVSPAGAGRADDVVRALGLESLNPTLERVELLLRDGAESEASLGPVG